MERRHTRTESAARHWKTAGLSLCAAAALTTLAPAQQTLADGEVPIQGTVAGSYVDTWAGDGVFEVLTETQTGGKPSKRTSLLEHEWTFDVPAGAAVELFVRGHHGANAEGDDFVLAWSADGAAWVDLLTVTKTSDDGAYQSAALDPGVSGPIRVRARDTDRTQGHSTLDSLFVDHLYVQTSPAAGPPAAPSDLAVHRGGGAGYDGLKVTWTDNSANEDGFRLRRSLDQILWDPPVTVGADVITFLDGGLALNTTYYYAVQAFNAQGDSAWSNVASATTLPPLLYTTEIVDSRPGDHAAFAFDPSGAPAVAFLSGDDVVLARWSGQAWSSEVVDTGIVTDCLDLAFAPDGRAGLVYGAVTYAEGVGGSWTVESIQGRTENTRVSLAFDPDGNPSVAYHGNKDPKAKQPAGLRFARRVAGVWDIDLVDEGTFIWFKSLAFDPAGQPAIAYKSQGVLTGWENYLDDELRFARWNGTSWDVHVDVGPRHGVHAELAFDPVSGHPAMVHSPDAPNYGALEYLHWDGSTWLRETVVTNYVGPVSDLEFTSLGVPYVATWCYGTYADTPLSHLWVHHWSGTEWEHEVVQPFGSFGDFTLGLALDPLERPALAWGHSEGPRYAFK